MVWQVFFMSQLMSYFCKVFISSLQLMFYKVNGAVVILSILVLIQYDTPKSHSDFKNP